MGKGLCVRKPDDPEQEFAQGWGRPITHRPDFSCQARSMHAHRCISGEKTCPWAVYSYLDVVLFGDFLLDKEGLDGVTLVALELQHLGVCFLVLEHGSVAAMLLLDGFQNLFEIQLLGETCHSCDGLATVALLDANVHSTLLKCDPACSF